MLKVLAIWFMLICPIALGQEQPHKTAIYLECPCSDPVGSVYATALRDAIASSPRYAETHNSEEKDSNGKVKVYHWHLDIISLDPFNNGGQNAVLSLVLLAGDDIFMTHSVQFCPKVEMQSCVQQTVAFFDSFISSIK